jgi:protein-tyrosine-phosphatase
MARALLDQRFPGRFYTQSAGIAPGERDPFVDVVLGEIGITIGDHQPRALEDLEDLNFDLAITLSPEAHHRTLDLTRSQALAVEYWPTLDPSTAIGAREQILFAYRELRTRLTTRIEGRFGSLTN